MVMKKRFLLELSRLMLENQSQCATRLVQNQCTMKKDQCSSQRLLEKNWPSFTLRGAQNTPQNMREM